MLLAKMAGKEYVGFIDADNYVPGAVNEYVKIFASGIAMSNTPYTMIRVSWIYKPKVSESGLYFSKWGRVSEVTNQYLNSLISYYTGFETEIMQVETRNPHFHEEKGDIHLKEMFNGSLGCIYHSKICPPRLREKVIEELHGKGILEEGQEPPLLQKISPFKSIDTYQFANILHNRATSFVHSG